jgi:prepilin-type N-terminal cleavage/methylation domain-containing protein
MMLKNKESKKGFTLIELLVVVAIIGMLSSVVMIAFGQTRAKSRDAKRLSDMKEISKGMEIYYSTSQGYPDKAVWDSLQPSGGMLTCDGIEAIRVPNDKVPGYSYDYFSGGDGAVGCGGTVWSEYKIEFTTEYSTELGEAGIYYMSPKGFSSTAPF